VFAAGRLLVRGGVCRGDGRLRGGGVGVCLGEAAGEGRCFVELAGVDR
jgi:hypothetical protein